MDNKQLFTILKHDERVGDYNFLGVFPRDLIPVDSVTKFPCCFVVNTKPHTHPGEHWVCVLKTEDNKGIYFDSYGQPPFNFEEVGLVLENCTEWKFNDVPLQSPLSTVCGQYCIFFLTHIVRGYSLKHIAHMLNEGDSCANDAFIYNYIKEMYPVEKIKQVKVIDFPFIFSQISKSINTSV